MRDNLTPAPELPADSPLQSAGVAPARKPFNIGIFLNRYGLVVVWVIVIGVFALLKPDVFFTWRNFQTILSTQAVLLIISLALLPALAAGEYDLSVGGVMGVAVVIMGYLNILHQWPVGLAVLVALGAGLIVGLVNTFFIVVIGIDSLVMTLGMGTLLAGAAIGINNLSIGGISDVLVALFRTRVLNVQMIFFYGLALTFIMWYVFSYTPLGRYIYFVGSGREVARLTGIPVNRIRAGALISSSLLSAFAGVALAGLLGSADPNAGPRYLLPAFASAYLGSTAITPGRFNAWGVFIAVYFLATGITGLQMIGLSGWIEQAFYGGSLIIAVTFSHLAKVRSARQQ